MKGEDGRTSRDGLVTVLEIARWPIVAISSFSKFKADFKVLASTIPASFVNMFWRTL